MTVNCQEAEALRKEFQECANNAERRIDSLTHQVNGIRGDLMRIDGDLKKLTVSVENMSESMGVIADNTTQFMEVLRMYQNVKGFSWVVKNGAIALIGSAALITAVVFLAGVKIHIG